MIDNSIIDAKTPLICSALTKWAQIIRTSRGRVAKTDLGMSK